MYCSSRGLQAQIMLGALDLARIQVDFPGHAVAGWYCATRDHLWSERLVAETWFDVPTLEKSWRNRLTL